MKVTGQRGPIPLEQARGRQSGDVGKSDSSSPTRGERVQVSSQARVLADARAPEVPDQDRIARLKEAIVNGDFKIDADRIAEAMLREEV